MVWYVNDTKDILWYTNGTVGNVSIRLWDGSSWTNVSQSTCSGSSCSGIGESSFLNWNVSDIKKENCKINITSVNDSSVSDESDVVFHIRPKISVTSPAESQEITATNSYSNIINWSIVGSTISRVDIVYYNATYNQTIAPYVLASLGTYNWDNVPNFINNSVRIKIVDNSTSTPSDVVYGNSSTFSIIGKISIVQPVGGESWTTFTNTSQIKWNATGVNALCDIWYSPNSGSTWNYVKTVTINTDGIGLTFWDANFSYPVTNNGRIKINSSLNDHINGSSPADFNLTAQLDVINPENGTAWVSNTTYPINWTTLGGSTALPNVTLWFYNNSSWSQIGSGNITNTGNYSWKVPTDVISTNCKIRVQSPINSNNNNESSPRFTVKR